MHNTFFAFQMWASNFRLVNRIIIVPILKIPKSLSSAKWPLLELYVELSNGCCHLEISWESQASHPFPNPCILRSCHNKLLSVPWLKPGSSWLPTFVHTFSFAWNTIQKSLNSHILLSYPVGLSLNGLTYLDWVRWSAAFALASCSTHYISPALLVDLAKQAKTF